MNHKQLNLTGEDKFDPNDILDKDSDDYRNEVLHSYKIIADNKTS